MKDLPIVSLSNLVVNYGSTTVIQGLDLDIMDKEFITLLGPSGCGKTTILRVIGGFEEVTSGDVYFSGKKMTNLPPYKRPVNTVFQSYALFPHLNVYENIAFGLKVQNQKDDEISQTVKEMLRLVNLEGYEKRNIQTLSGGQQQRVAIARALANKPKILLLDEPLAALDLKLRKGMQRELKDIQEKLDITFIFVTHDQEEALTMSDRVVVLRGGEIQQIGTPEDVYNEPINAYVADFIGASNIVDGIMHEDYKVEFAGTEFSCMDSGFDEMEEVDVVVRPEDIKIVSAEEGDMIGTVESVIFKGVHYEIIVESTGYKWIIHSTGYVEEDTVIGMELYPDDIHIMKKMEEE